MDYIDCLTIDNVNYLIMDTLDIKNNKYYYLVNENDATDIYIRKVVNEDNQEYIVNLDNEEELNEVMKIFYEKHKNEN